MLRRFCAFLALSFAFSLVLPEDGDAHIMETVSSYIVSGIRVYSESQDRGDAEKELLAMARSAAFSYIKLYLNKSDISTRDIDIESFILEFSMTSISRHNKGFVGVFEIVFDRAAIDAFLVVLGEHSAVDGPNVFRVVTDGDLRIWVKVQHALKLTNLKYQVSLIDSNFIEVAILDSTTHEIEKLLIAHGLEIIQNNRLQFIKIISMYDDR